MNSSYSTAWLSRIEDSETFKYKILETLAQQVFVYIFKLFSMFLLLSNEKFYN